MVLPPVTKVIYVDEDAEGENNGSSWTHAYDNLQAALTEADGVNRTQIWLAEGVYRPDAGPGRTAGDRTASFQLKNRLEIIGGFQGHEHSVDERVSHGFITYLSGDIGAQNWSGDNSYHVVNASGTDRTAVLSDLGVVDGMADGPGQWNKRGAGVLADNGSPSLRFMGFFNNHASGSSSGGGALCVYNGGSPAVFSALSVQLRGVGRGGQAEHGQFRGFLQHPVSGKPGGQRRSLGSLGKQCFDYPLDDDRKQRHHRRSSLRGE